MRGNIPRSHGISYLYYREQLRDLLNRAGEFRELKEEEV